MIPPADPELLSAALAQETLLPSPYGDGPPYPNPNDRVRVAVYDPISGRIAQIVECGLQDMERQHQAFPGCEYLEILDPTVNPRDYAVDLKTLTFVPKTVPTEADLATKEHELWRAARVTSFQSGGRTYQMNPEALQAMTIAALIGGAITIDGAAVAHTPDEAKQVLEDYAAVRDANAAQFDDLLRQAKSAPDRDSLAKINFGA